MIKKGRGTARKRVLAFLQEHGPMHTKQLQELLGTGHSAMSKCLGSASRAGLIHCVKTYNTLGPPIRTWHLGPDPQPQLPPVVQALVDLGPSNISELAEHLDWKVQRVREGLKRARRNGEAYVKDWLQDTRLRSVWAAGKGRDKRRPPALGPTERTHRYYMRNRALIQAKENGRPATWVTGLAA